jgi:hypothetical protein
LLAIVEEALKEPVKKDFVKSYRKDVKTLMVHRGGNKAGRYPEVATYADGGRKGVIWLPEGREGWGWSWVVGELRKMLTFLGSKARSLVSEASTSEGIKKGGVSSNRLGGVTPSFAEVVRGKAVFHVKHPWLRVLEIELCGLDQLPEVWCRVVEGRRMAVNCYALDEQPHESTEK